MTNEKIYIGIDNQIVEAEGQILQDILQFQEQIKNEKEIEIANIKLNLATKAALLERLGLTQEEFNTLIA